MKFVKQFLNVVVTGAVACFLFFGAENAIAEESTNLKNELELNADGILNIKAPELWVKVSDDAAAGALGKEIVAGKFEKGTLVMPKGESCASLVYGRLLTRGPNSGKKTTAFLKDLGIDPKVQYRALQLLNNCSPEQMKEGQVVMYIKKPSKSNLTGKVNLDSSTANQAEAPVGIEADLRSLSKNLLEGRINILPDSDQEKIKNAHGVVDVAVALMTVLEKQSKEIDALKQRLLAIDQAAAKHQIESNPIFKVQRSLQSSEGFVGSITRYWLPSSALLFLLGLFLCYALGKTVWSNRELKRSLREKWREVGELRVSLELTFKKILQAQMERITTLEEQVRALVNSQLTASVETFQKGLNEFLVANMQIANQIATAFERQSATPPSKAQKKIHDLASTAAEAVVAETLLEQPTNAQETIQVVGYDGTAWNLPVCNIEWGRYNFRCPACDENLQNTTSAKISRHWLNSSHSFELPCCMETTIAPMQEKVGVEKIDNGVTYRLFSGGACKTKCNKCGTVVSTSNEDALLQTMKQYHENCTDAADAEARTEIKPRLNHVSSSISTA